MEIDRVDIIATTISGSVADWQKLKSMEGEFKKHCAGQVTLHMVDSHKKARSTARELTSAGGRILVSAGGAGTFNSVLEGCRVGLAIPRDLILAFLRKGSADLIGKALGIPDDLTLAVEAICKGIQRENFVFADVLEVDGQNIEKRHFLGFSGVGVFGDAPRFTESRFIKYYKGFLGSLFGDLGPFMVGVNLALLKHHIEKARGKNLYLEARGDSLELPIDKYISIIILNGDLSEDFPLAREVPLGSGDFKVVAIRDRGLPSSYRQLISCWKGDVFEKADELGIESFRTAEFEIIPRSAERYMVNVDGLFSWAEGPIRYSICDRVRLVSARSSSFSTEG